MEEHKESLDHGGAAADVCGRELRGVHRIRDSVSRYN